MGVKPLFTPSAIRKRFKAAQRKLDKAVLRTFQYIGEQCVTEARTNGDYHDQTGNLRSSVGYLILRNGVVQRSAFPGSAAEGAITGEEVARRLATEYATGWVLIVVAGMNYAVKVESKGRNVLTSAEQVAQREVPRLIKQLRSATQQLR